MELSDFETKTYFTPFELEHILQIPMTDIVEVFAKTPKVAEPRGCYEAEACRELLAKLCRRRVYADIIARNNVNAEPEIRRSEDEGESHRIGLLDVSRNHAFEVRFPGDLRNYLDTRST